MASGKKREAEGTTNQYGPAGELADALELESLAAAEARGEVDTPRLHRARPSEVFSVRLPENAADELRRRAQVEGVSAGVLLRRWALGVLTGDSGEALTHQQAEELFRETLQRAAVEVITSVSDAPRRSGLNLGPRLVQQSRRERRPA
jgi:hypothetical protein